MSPLMIRPDKDELLQFLEEKLRNKFMIACVGSPLRSDDRAGLEVCELLRRKGIIDARLIECEYGLETCLDKIIRLKPRGIIMIDAGYAENISPGTIVLSSIENVRDSFTLATTHNIPIRLMLKVLESEANIKDFYVMAIIAEKLEIGIQLSRRVREAVENLAEIVWEALTRTRQE